MSFIFDHQAMSSTPSAPSVLPARIQARIWAGLFALLLLAVVVGAVLLF